MTLIGAVGEAVARAGRISTAYDAMYFALTKMGILRLR